MMRVTVFVCLLLNIDSSLARVQLRSRAPVTKGDLAKRDNEVVPGCTEAEYNRYKIILCGKTLTECELEWCETYKHEWKIKFGACNTVGCPAPEAEAPPEEEPEKEEPAP